MANNLHRQIQEGEEVVLKGGAVFVADGGFGMSHCTIGYAIFGYWKEKGPETGRDRIEGYDLDREATEKHQNTPAEDPNYMDQYTPNQPYRGGGTH